MGDDLLTYAVYLIILVIVGITHLVKKAIEKARKGETGKGINLAKTVQDQIDRYRDRVRERTGVGGFLGQFIPEEEAAPRPPPPPPQEAPARPATPPPLRPAREAVVPRMPAPEVRPRAFWKDAEVEAAAKSSAKREAAAAVALAARGPIRLNQNDIRRAVVMAELLGPPVAERDEYRLF